MSGWIRSHLRWALVGCASVFLFIAGGTAYAAFIVNSNADVAPDAISGHAPPSGDHSNIISGSVGNTDLALNSVKGGNIINGDVGTADLGASSVTSAKIADGTVGTVDLAPNSVDSSKIADGTITSNDVGLGTLTPGDIHGVHSMDTSGLVLVDDPVDGNVATNTLLVSSGGLLLNSHCTDTGGGSVTAEVNAVFDFTDQMAVTSDAPGGMTNLGTVDAVQVANFGPTTAGHLGAGKVTVVAPFQPMLSGILTVGTHVLGHDCVFAANSLG